VRTLEHRRHSRRDPAGAHLNARGRELARRVAPSLPRFDRVVTSPRLRAVETAEALGLRVDAQIPELAEMPEETGIPIEELRGAGFAEFAAYCVRSTEMARYAAREAEAWRRELLRVPDGGALLMVSHGGIIEAGTVGAIGAAAAAGWGPSLGYLEGVRLRHDGEAWVDGAPVRVGSGSAGSP
jgi:broad specificity phosphatase PhoE